MSNQIDSALAVPELIAALKKEPANWDYKDKLIIDATAEFVGRMAIVELREKLVEKAFVHVKPE